MRSLTIATLVALAVVLVALLGTGCYDKENVEQLQREAESDAKSLVGQVIWPPEDHPEYGVDNSGQKLWHVSLTVLEAYPKVWGEAYDVIVTSCALKITADAGKPCNVASFTNEGSDRYKPSNNSSGYTTEVYGKSIVCTYRYAENLVTSCVSVPPSISWRNNPEGRWWKIILEQGTTCEPDPDSPSAPPKPAKAEKTGG